MTPIRLPWGLQNLIRQTETRQPQKYDTNSTTLGSSKSDPTNQPLKSTVRQIVRDSDNLKIPQIFNKWGSRQGFVFLVSDSDTRQPASQSEKNTMV